MSEETDAGARGSRPCVDAQPPMQDVTTNRVHAAAQASAQRRAGQAPAPPGPTVAHKADFSRIRYAQCWEDADVLLAGLDVQPGDRCLSIASAGDNSLSMLTCKPARVVAVDLNPAQLHCLALRVAAFRELQHPELLELIGSLESDRRVQLYAKCQPHLDDEARAFWDAHPDLIANGIGEAGRFERYFRIFRTRALPLVHSRKRIDALLQPRDRVAREAFYARSWNNARWRCLFRVFFSRVVMGRLGRDPAFFDYVDGSVADRILTRTRHALTHLAPADNPYLQWILKARHTTALPHYLREESFETIRANLDSLEWRLCSIEDLLATAAERFDRFNLSDIFEYVSPADYHALLARLIEHANPGARLAYWNMLAPRHRPDSLADRLEPIDARTLFDQDKAWFYSDFVVEEVTGR